MGSVPGLASSRSTKTGRLEGAIGSHDPGKAFDTLAHARIIGPIRPAGRGPLFAGCVDLILPRARDRDDLGGATEAQRVGARVHAVVHLLIEVENCSLDVQGNVSDVSPPTIVQFDVGSIDTNMVIGTRLHLLDQGADGDEVPTLFRLTKSVLLDGGLERVLVWCDKETELLCSGRRPGKFFRVRHDTF